MKISARTKLIVWSYCLFAMIIAKELQDALSTARISHWALVAIFSCGLLLMLTLDTAGAV
jgi:hypothetical protein